MPGSSSLPGLLVDKSSSQKGLRKKDPLLMVVYSINNLIFRYSTALHAATLLLDLNSLPPTFKPEKCIQNDKLEIHLHTQHCNRMASIPGVSPPCNMLCSIHRYCCQWPCQPPPPTTHAAFHFSSMIACLLTICTTREI